MRIMVINTKGGCGKSTTAQQVFCPYLFGKGGGKKKVRLVEVDEQNWDGAVFQKSDVIDWQGYKLIEMDKLISEIAENQDLVVDTGGNITGERCLQEFYERGYINAIDLFVIPLSSGEQDAVNAVSTYLKIIEKKRDARIVFALSQVFDVDEKAVRMQFWAWEKAKENLKKTKEIWVPASFVVGQSRRFGKTVFEIAQRDESKIQRELMEAVEKGDSKKAYELSNKLFLINKSRQWWSYIKNQVEQALNG